MRCSVCGSRNVKKILNNFPYSYQGINVILNGVVHTMCSCDECREASIEIPDEYDLKALIVENKNIDKMRFTFTDEGWQLIGG